MSISQHHCKIVLNTKMSVKILKGRDLRQTIKHPIGEFFFSSCERFADRICQIDAILDRTESYATVKQKSTRVAIEMQKRGVTSDDVIVLCTKVTLDTIIPILACAYLGAKVANLDPSQSARQMSHLLSLVSPKMMFVEKDSVSLIEESLKNASLTTDLVVFEESETRPTLGDFLKPKPNEASFRPAKIDINETALIFFSSGTTGLPKAICHSHYSFQHVAYSLYESNCRCDSVLSFTSFYWVSAMMLLMTSFISGGHRVLCGPLEAEKAFQVIDKYKISFVFMAPILTYTLTSFEHSRKYDTSSLRTLIIGGTPMSSSQLERLSATFVHTNIVFAYGLTEVGLATIFYQNENRDFIRKKVGSCGSVVVGATIKVVDLTTRDPLGCNQKGEICVKNKSAMKGYYKVDSSDSFDQDGFFKTGDIGYYDEDKYFYVIERLKDMFKYLSWHVVPSAIEAVLLEHPAVQDAVVFGVPRSEEEGEAPTACVILKAKQNVREKQIEEFVAERVSNYEKLRGGVFFVKELQKTPSGKLMRKEIRTSFLKSL